MNTTEFENHLVFEKIEQIKNQLSNNELREFIEINKLSYYDSAINYISERLKITIPILVSATEINGLKNELDAAFEQINYFVNNKNNGHLSNADANFESATNRMRNIPISISKNDFNFSKNISSFENLVKSKYNVIEKENTTLKTELTKIKSDLQLKQNEIAQLSSLLTTKTNEINNLISSFSTEFGNFKSTANQNIESDRKNFRNEITNDRNTFRTEITTDREIFRKEIDEKINEIEKNTTQTVESINVKLEEAKKLVNIIGNVGVTGNYQNIANEHKATANFWRVLAIVFMTILSGLLIYAIWDVSSANYDWIKSVIRIVAAAALSYPATYAARESSKHRKLENINRKLELELASLSPFIEILPEDKKRDIKSKLVEKYFGNHYEISNDKEDKTEELSLSGFEQILKAILPFLKK